MTVAWKCNMPPSSIVPPENTAISISGNSVKNAHKTNHKNIDDDGRDGDGDGRWTRTLTKCVV